jgi:uncharacterized protein (TIGR03067 family)
MSRTSLPAALWLLLVPGSVRDADDSIAVEMRALQGTWHMLYMEIDGFRSPAAEKNIRMRIEGDTMTDLDLERPTMRGTFTIDPAKKPKHLDFTPVDGPLKGSVIHHVYELKDGRLYLAAYDDFRATRERPKSIETDSAPGVSTTIFVPADQIRPEVIKRGMMKKQGEPDDVPGAVPATILAARYFDAIRQEKPELVMECVEVPWLRRETLLKDRDEVLAYFRRAIPAEFGYLKAGSPSPRIREIIPFAKARDRFGPAVRPHLDALLSANDLLVEVDVSRRVAEVEPHYLLVRLKGKDGQPTVVGYTRIPRGVPSTKREDRPGRRDAPKRPTP